MTAETIPNSEGDPASETGAVQAPESAAPTTEAKEKPTWRYWLAAWASMLVWMVILWAMVPLYLQLHGISLWQVGLSGIGLGVLDSQSLQNFTQFNYVGYPFPNNEPTAAAMWVEIIFWSYVGVAASQVYAISQLISLKMPFEAGRYLIRTFGIVIRAVALSTALIFLLRIVTLTVGPVAVDMRQADIQTVIAVSFVIGFYNEDTERVLRKIWKQVAQTVGIDSKKESAKLAHR